LLTHSKLKKIILITFML